MNNNQKSSESPFFSHFSAPHPIACHFHRICLTGPEISLAYCDTINILTVLCRSAQHTDKAYVGLLQGITSKTLFMQICKLRIDKTLCLKESLFMSGSSRLTGCIVELHREPQAPRCGQLLFLHEAPHTDE